MALTDEDKAWLEARFESLDSRLLTLENGMLAVQNRLSGSRST